jgi:hypothetical protein
LWIATPMPAPIAIPIAIAAPCCRCCIHDSP